jgi:hypothetical protein
LGLEHDPPRLLEKRGSLGGCECVHFQCGWASAVVLRSRRGVWGDGRVGEEGTQERGYFGVVVLHCIGGLGGLAR